MRGSGGCSYLSFRGGPQGRTRNPEVIPVQRAVTNYSDTQLTVVRWLRAFGESPNYGVHLFLGRNNCGCDAVGFAFWISEPFLTLKNVFQVGNGWLVFRWETAG
jgi:hypothetical protein